MLRGWLMSEQFLHHHKTGGWPSRNKWNIPSLQNKTCTLYCEVQSNLGGMVKSVKNPTKNVRKQQTLAEYDVTGSVKV